MFPTDRGAWSPLWASFVRGEAMVGVAGVADRYSRELMCRAVVGLGPSGPFPGKPQTLSIVGGGQDRR